MMWLAWLLAACGVVLLLIAALGVLRLPDALARQHAATKAATLAISLFSLGLAVAALLAGWGWDWWLRLLLINVFLLLTLPLASHALAGAGVSETIPPRDNPD